VSAQAEGPCKVTVLLSQQDFRRLDAYCTERAFKKSTLLARLVREYLDSEGFRGSKGADPQRRRK